MTIKGAAAIQSAIENAFQDHDVLLTLYHKGTVISQHLTTLDAVELDVDSAGIADDEADVMTDAEWDAFARSLTVYGEAIEAVEAEGQMLNTEATLIIDDPQALRARCYADSMRIESGDWLLEIRSLREPIRHRTQDMVVGG